MNHDQSIHQTQTDILRELLFQPQAGFTQMQKIAGLDSDHFKFHIQRLIELGYIEKVERGVYRLTTLGKEYANRLDTDKSKIERQPKSAVIIVLQDDQQRVLVQERLKHPYYGFWGYPGGKIQWGETITQAAERELLEETGLSATLEHKGVYHELVTEKESGNMLEDKIFHVFGGHNPTGSLLIEFEGGRNAWKYLDELASIEKKYASCDIETEVGLGRIAFIEKTQIYSKDEF